MAKKFEGYKCSNCDEWEPTIDNTKLGECEKTSEILHFSYVGSGYLNQILYPEYFSCVHWNLKEEQDG